MSAERWLTTLGLRLRSLVGGRALDRELDDELAFHLDRQIEQHIARGLSPGQARTAALRSLGGVDQRKEEMRDARRVAGQLGIPYYVVNFEQQFEAMEESKAEAQIFQALSSAISEVMKNFGGALNTAARGG